MSIHHVYPEQYDQQLADKLSQLQQQFSCLNIPDIEVFTSPASNYRMRAEFKIWHEDNQAFYAMYQPGEYKRPFVIENFPVGSELINSLMPKLLAAVNQDNLLRRKLFQVEFLTTLSGQAVITLLYHRPLDDQWQASAETLSNALGCSVSGRSRKQKRVIGQDYVIESLQVQDQTFHYQQVETGFTQPNAEVCQKMLGWAVECSQNLGGDLLELYCGNGNFTLPLARNFNRVLATEVSKTSVNSANYNINLNQTDNVDVVRISSEEFSQAMDGVREFRRLQSIKLTEYNFSTIFVDPPRAGLDDHTVEVVKRFDYILYISCNPETLFNNLQSISQTHDALRFAVFDQFPYTPHLECGVLLRKKSSS